MNTHFSLDYVGLVAERQLPYELTPIPLTFALHSVNGEVTQLLNDVDSVYAELWPGESITLHFPVPPLPNEGWSRSFILKSRGRYETFASEGRPFGKPASQFQVSLPSEFHLAQNHPNPFNPETVIEYALPQPSNITLTIYNVIGQQVHSWDISSQPPGYHTIRWDATDRFGNRVPSGIYLYRLQASTFAASKKMLLLR